MRDDEVTESINGLEAQFPDGAYCTGWVLVSEWLLPDGTKRLAATKTAGLTQWGATGMLHHTLYSGEEYE